MSKKHKLKSATGETMPKEPKNADAKDDDWDELGEELAEGEEPEEEPEEEEDFG